MGQQSEYILPRVWKTGKNLAGKWGSINQPTAGSRYEKNLEKGDEPIQLYSLATPNGVKVAIMLEELLALGLEGARYDAHKINIMEGEQFSSGFVEINPNAKIPAIIDQSIQPNISIFESGAILLYLAEKFNAFLPKAVQARTKCLSWLFWQMGSAPYLGGGFGHFYRYAPEKNEYCIDRFTMEVKRQFDVLNKQLKNNEYICGESYTIADIAIFPWYGGVALNRVYEAAEFLDVESYPNLLRWVKQVDNREAVQKGKLVTPF